MDYLTTGKQRKAQPTTWRRRRLVTSMLVRTIDSVPGHFMEFVAITVDGPTIHFARCECDWESAREQVPLDVVEAAARRHLEQSSSQD